MKSVEPAPPAQNATSPTRFPHFVCPSCRSALEHVTGTALRCARENLTFRQVDGIWRFLTPERAPHFRRFVREYETIREREGRGSNDPAFYRALPFRDLTGRFAEQWRIRAVTYAAFVRRVLTPLQETLARPVRVLDVGAGNGWLCNRLAQLRHVPVALDLLTNPFDGLGAGRHYSEPFERVQAEFDRLPFPEGHFDLVVFNAALHYSENYETTLRESLRVLQPAGRLVVLDSPIYRNAESGQEMVRERERAFQQQFGLASDALSSEHFLTFDRLTQLGETLGLDWQIFIPNYGLKWRLKPLLARLRRRREPATFAILTACRK